MMNKVTQGVIDTTVDWHKYNAKIKFRAWHKEDKRMWDVCTIYFEDEPEMIELRFDHGSDPCELTQVWPHEIELMQWSGLQDKNGMDIYEGDIVDIKQISEQQQKAIVIFKDGTFSIMHPQIGIYKTFDMVVSHGMTLTVIGNVYEHKELLK